MAAGSALRCHDVRLRRRGRRRYNAARRRGRRRYGCDRMRGSLRSGDMSLRCRTTARAPSPRVRPHVRLTSFGGYVATGGTRFIASAPVPPLGRNKCDPPANHHSLPTAIYISTLLHGHFCDGEAPSLRVRPHVRLASFGGYLATMPHDGEGAVATGVVAGEGAPLLRPHVRLTSFGGYVATGVGIAVAAVPAAWHVATAPSPSQAEWLRRGCYCA